MLDTSVRTEGDAPATRAAFVALWRAANVPLLGSVATSADARMRLQRLRLDDAVMAAKETFATAFEEWVEEDDARMDRYACVMTAGSDELLGIPVHQVVGDSMRLVGSLTWAKLWRERDVAMSAHLEEDGTVRWAPSACAVRGTTWLMRCGAGRVVASGACWNGRLRGLARPRRCGQFGCTDGCEGRGGRRRWRSW